MFEIWDRVRKLEGKTLTTLHRKKPFKVVAVEEDVVRILPADGSGKERTMLRDRVEHMASLAVPRNELRLRTKREYPDSRNTSYIA